MLHLASRTYSREKSSADRAEKVSALQEKVKSAVPFSEQDAIKASTASMDEKAVSAEADETMNMPERRNRHISAEKCFLFKAVSSL